MNKGREERREEEGGEEGGRREEGRGGRMCRGRVLAVAGAAAVVVFLFHDQECV